MAVIIQVLSLLLCWAKREEVKSQILKHVIIDVYSLFITGVVSKSEKAITSSCLSVTMVTGKCTSTWQDTITKGSSYEH